MKDTYRKQPFSYLLMGILFFIIVSVVLAAIWINYDTSRATTQANAERLKVITESHIDNSFRMIDTGLKIYDNTYNEDMKEAFIPVMDAYTRSDGDPSTMDLLSLKQEIGGMDIFIINNQCVVEYTSLPRDLNLDFAVIYPDFCEYLHLIWNTSGFYPDRVVMEWFNGTMTKYAMMPTPDHHYIIELGIEAEQFTGERMQLQYSNVIDEVQAFNPYIDDVLVYQKQKRLVYNASYIPSPEDSAMLEYLLWENRTSQVVKERDPDRTIVWQVIDLRDPAYGADMSLFAKITYDDEMLEQELNHIALIHGFAAILVILLGGLIAIMISRKISGPIENLVDDVNTIAGGELDHAIRPVHSLEFSTLSASIQVMVDRLKDEIRKCQVNEERFTDLVNLLPQGVFETDRKGTVTFANPHAYEVFGYTPGDITEGFSIFKVIAPDDMERARAVFTTILAGEKTKGTEYLGLRKDGSMFPIMVHTSTRTEDGIVTGIRGTLVDITRLKQVEAEIRELNLDLEQRIANRTAELESANQEMEAFTYSVSHDLRAPLRAIDGFSHLLTSTAGTRLDTQETHCIDVIRQNVRLMDDLINGLLTLSRMGRQELKLEPVSPESLVREVIAGILERVPGRHIAIIVGTLPPCVANRVMLRQVFANLIDNAVKYTRHTSEARIEIGAFSRDSRIVYYVRDNGVGFDMAYAAKVFVPFQRLHKPGDYEGSGIGLAIVDRIIRRHGGEIWVESEPGKGSSFYFTVGGSPGGSLS